MKIDLDNGSKIFVELRYITTPSETSDFSTPV
jgi:hypothetical protein